MITLRKPSHSITTPCSTIFAPLKTSPFPRKHRRPYTYTSSKQACKAIHPPQAEQHSTAHSYPSQRKEPQIPRSFRRVQLSFSQPSILIMQIGLLHTVLAVQIHDTQHIELAALGGRDTAADTGLAGHEGCGVALCYGCGRSEGEEGGEDEGGEHCCGLSWLVWLVWFGWLEEGD